MGHAVRVEQLCKSFGDFDAVRGISFDVDAGETFGFLGPNGAGKSTTISMLCTLARPTRGDAWVAGRHIVDERDAVRRRIGLVFQDPTLDDLLTAEENLIFHAVLYGVPGAEVRPRMDAVLDLVGLADRRNDLVRTFSGGMKRRLEIARGLLHSPRVLFLDEPTVGLDPQTRSHIWQYVTRLKDEQDITLFLTTHYMDEAEYCDRIAIIDNGTIVALDTPANLKASVGADTVIVNTSDDATAARQLRERLGIEATATGEGLRILVANGQAFVPRLFGGAIDPTVRTVTVHRPSLDDVFFKYAGRAIRDAQVGAGDRLRASPMMRGFGAGRR
ncbi:MAG: type transport system ATP-binding protein [Acidimicrobiia bacterium]|nr:type transport system ATP-binding protein [Acidimicrobiia bacterium]